MAPARFRDLNRVPAHGAASTVHEDPLPGLALGRRREHVDLVEAVVLGHGHDGRSWASEPPVEFTVSTVGPAGL